MVASVLRSRRPVGLVRAPAALQGRTWWVAAHVDEEDRAPVAARGGFGGDGGVRQIHTSQVNEMWPLAVGLGVAATAIGAKYVIQVR